MTSSLALFSKIERLRKLARSSQDGYSRSPIDLDWRTSVVDLVPLLHPRYERPDHMAPYGAVLDAAPGSDVRQIIAAPPQHGKTTLTQTALVKWLALARPDETFAYVTYNQDRSDSVAIRTRALAEEAGLEPQGTMREWRVRTGAWVKFTSIGGSLTGYPVSAAMVIDDPYKDRAEAESKRVRQRVLDWSTDVAFTRLHPGTAALLMATRWHVADLSGHLHATKGWPYLNLQAVAEGDTDADGRVIEDPLGRAPGEPLWPSRRPLEFLADYRKEPYSWAGMWQGAPRPRGTELFGPPHWYEDSELPKSGYAAGHGIDLAYSAKTQSDYSVVLSGIRHEERLFLVAMVHKQCKAEEFTPFLRKARADWPGRMLWRASGPEHGSAGFFKRDGIPIIVQQPPGDKYITALPASAAWNAGKILLPRNPKHRVWVEPLVDEVTSFTGLADVHDDIVDGLSSLHDLLMPARRSTCATAPDQSQRAVA